MRLEMKGRKGSENVWEISVHPINSTNLELRAMTEDVNKTFDIIEAKSTLENFSTKLEILKNDNEMVNFQEI